MKERLIAAGLLGLSGFGGSACNKDYVEGNIADIREEPYSSSVATWTEEIPFCENETGDTKECPLTPFEITAIIEDQADKVISLQKPDGSIQTYYVWPRVTKNATVGESIKFNTHHGSLTDNNNQKTIISKIKIDQ